MDEYRMNGHDAIIYFLLGVLFWMFLGVAFLFAFKSAVRRGILLVAITKTSEN